jgi:hypothetical protein
MGLDHAATPAQFPLPGVVLGVVDGTDEGVDVTGFEVEVIGVVVVVVGGAEDGIEAPAQALTRGLLETKYTI